MVVPTTTIVGCCVTNVNRAGSGWFRNTQRPIRAILSAPYQSARSLAETHENCPRNALGAEITTKYAMAYAKAAKRPPGSAREVAKQPRKPRAPKYSYDTVKVLQKVWAASGDSAGSTSRPPCGSSSTGSIDRYLKPAKASDQIRDISTTEPSPLLRSSITIRNNAHVHILTALKQAVAEVLP